MTSPFDLEARCRGCGLYEVRSQQVCPGLDRLMREEAEAKERAGRLRSLAVAEAPNGPPGVVGLVRREAGRGRRRAPLALPPGPPTSSVSTDQREEVPHARASRAVR